MKFCNIEEAKIDVNYLTKSGERKHMAVFARFPEKMTMYEIAAMVKRRDPTIFNILNWRFDNMKQPRAHNTSIHVRNDMRKCRQAIMIQIIISSICIVSALALAAIYVF